MTKYEKDYLGIFTNTLQNGTWIANERTGVNCLTIPFAMYQMGPNDNDPLLTCRQSFPVSAFAEILGYIRRYEWATDFDKIGSPTWYTNANKTEAWLNNPNRLGENHLGKVYGAALDDDELPNLFDKLMRHHDDRGLLLNFWKPEKFELGCLRPCMYQHKFDIVDGHLHITSFQRSTDTACGMNFNSLQVRLLQKLICKITGLKVGTATHIMNNVHIYEPHIENVQYMLSQADERLDATVNSIEIADWVTSFDDVINSDRHARDYLVVNYPLKGEKIPFELIA